MSQEQPSVMTETLPVLPEPEWEVAKLFPRHGQWTEDDYLALPDEGRAELSDGCVEVLPMPTEAHQLILFFLLEALAAFVRARRMGIVLPSGLPVRLQTGKMREPDIVFLRREHANRRREQFWDGADLVMEVVSPDPKDRKRDYETKRSEYARAGIPEYWIVDPEERRILVLTLEGDHYRVHGDFRSGMVATSAMLPGFQVSVDEVFTSAEG
jgi:Uma2 family endonuclease